MISAQIDGLREMAGKLESYDQGYGTICQALRDAADTIWQLRDDLQRANAENAKLRELLAGVGQLLFTLDVDYCAVCPRDGINRPCPVYTSSGGECLYKTDMRDLGVKL